MQYEEEGGVLTLFTMAVVLLLPTVNDGLACGVILLGLPLLIMVALLLVVIVCCFCCCCCSTLAVGVAVVVVDVVEATSITPVTFTLE